MVKYRAHVVGTMTLPETYMNDDEPPVEVNHTAGIDTTFELEAADGAAAKEAFKVRVAAGIIDRGGIAFDGVVSAWSIDETVLLTDAPFTVDVEITQNVTVDF